MSKGDDNNKLASILEEKTKWMGKVQLPAVWLHTVLLSVQFENDLRANKKVTCWVS